jgi:hypothetical protein
MTRSDLSIRARSDMRIRELSDRLIKTKAILIGVVIVLILIAVHFVFQRI